MTQTAMADAPVAADDVYAIPLDQLNVSDPRRFQDNTVGRYFERLRNEDPVHYCADSPYGPYWSVTRFKDIMSVDTNHQVFSSESRFGGITIMDNNTVSTLPMFIAMDPPKHDIQRKTVSPIVAPENLAKLEGLIRSRTQAALDGLPLNQTFNWVERVSINLTTQMLATLFGFPWEDRAKLTRWSDVATTELDAGLVDSEEARMAELHECAAYMMRLWNERVNADPGPDLLSMLAHNEQTRHMSPEEFLGNMLLLIVGGNDTTRNSMTAGVLALNQFRGEYDKLCSNPALIGSMVSEVIRWQTPLAHMRRTALQDTELCGKKIRKGDKVVMWYTSGNRDASAIDRPDDLIIDRTRARHHLSFGFGIHRCVGNRLAELQLRILWEELLQRWPKPGQLEVVGEPKRVLSCFVNGYESLPVCINA